MEKYKNVQPKVNIHVDKLPDITIWNLKQHKYLIALDVHKAYDFVMLDILDAFIQNDPFFTSVEKEEWQEELRDLRALNMDISGNIIYRSQGIPQGSELAPYLFNYYMSRILEDPIIIELLKDCEFVIYADNIFIVNDFDNVEKCQLLVSNLNKAFKKYNFSFKNKYRIIYVAGIGYPTTMCKIDELDKYDTIKILGMKFSLIEHPRNGLLMILNLNDGFFKLKYKFSGPGYKMINIAKRYIIPKYNFYNSLLYNAALKDDYRNWFKKELRNWLKSSIVTVKISDNMLEHILGNIDKYSYFDFGNIYNTYSYWFNEFTTDFQMENNFKMLNKIKQLSKFIWDNKIPLTEKSLDIICLEDRAENLNTINKYPRYQKDINLVKSFRHLDILFNKFVTNQNPLSDSFDYLVNNSLYKDK